MARELYYVEGTPEGGIQRVRRSSVNNDELLNMQTAIPEMQSKLAYMQSDKTVMFQAVDGIIIEYAALGRRPLLEVYVKDSMTNAEIAFPKITYQNELDRILIDLNGSIETGFGLIA